MKKNIKIYWGLYPLAIIYGSIVYFRNKLFDWGILKSNSFPLPVICIGNISVGGTGKTPHTEYLIRLFKKDFHVAVLSRGYKRKSRGFVMAGPTSGIHDIGDEPYQMANKFRNITVAVDTDRCHGIQQLTDGSACTTPDVILLDDAYQHRYVKAGFYILLIDYNRPIHSDAMLPAGRLREPESGKQRANTIIVTKCPDNMSEEECNQFRKDIAPYPGQDLYFTRFSYGSMMSLTGDGQEVELSSFDSESQILLFTGIASPAPIIRKLNEYTHHIEEVSFPDHHDFTSADIQLVEEAYEKLDAEHRIIVTTEKDAARLVDNPLLKDSLKKNIYVLPIKVDFINNGAEKFNTRLMDFVTTYIKKH